MDGANTRSNSSSLLWAKKHEAFTAYTPFKDFNVGNFVLVKPHEPNFVAF
jgi:hypothetical protein